MGARLLGADGCHLGRLPAIRVLHFREYSRVTGEDTETQLPPPRSQSHTCLFSLNKDGPEASFLPAV